MFILHHIYLFSISIQDTSLTDGWYRTALIVSAAGLLPIITGWWWCLVSFLGNFSVFARFRIQNSEPQPTWRLLVLHVMCLRSFLGAMGNAAIMRPTPSYCDLLHMCSWYLLCCESAPNKKTDAVCSPSPQPRRITLPTAYCSWWPIDNRKAVRSTTLLQLYYYLPTYLPCVI